LVDPVADCSRRLLLAGIVAGAPASIPEIDPAGVGTVLALVTGALGLLERRRTQGG